MYETILKVITDVGTVVGVLGGIASLAINVQTFNNNRKKKKKQQQKKRRTPAKKKRRK
ncbi:hypothetical protein [Lysinibacillus xylanilyticus]|uniref:DUF3948 domain-containing protein n=1 Tax=Lysinibacillus xylanilyticus TaxID=582475 RepID=A0ABT4ENP8_9BACI|nr:hypothetical protein [Lysinibacillus xylanilyticus]MCY9547303.1 hypothetical protein [Lysinibacillus xylanilyticus]